MVRDRRLCRSAVMQPARCGQRSAWGRFGLSRIAAVMEAVVGQPDRVKAFERAAASCRRGTAKTGLRQRQMRASTRAGAARCGRSPARPRKAGNKPATATQSSPAAGDVAAGTVTPRQAHAI